MRTRSWIRVVACSALLLGGSWVVTPATETTTVRFQRLFDQLDATPVSCPEGLDRFGVAAEARCVTVPGTPKQVKKAFRGEFDLGDRNLDGWKRRAGFRVRQVLGIDELFLVAYDEKTPILAVVPFRPCPADPNVVSSEARGYEPPSATEKVYPEHPVQARQARQNGAAVLRLLVREDGSVGQVCVMSVMPEGYGFEQAAVQALRQWQFEAATVDGEAVESYSIQYFGWSID